MEVKTQIALFSESVLNSQYGVSTTTKRNGEVVISPINKIRGKELIVKYHYSHKNVNTSELYLGLFLNNVLYGVASFGIAMNPVPTTEIVKGTKLDEYLDLNRLWVSDEIQNNIESTFIGLCWKWLRKFRPEIKWIQSFADGRVGVGTIYQATNFLYCGCHESTFWEDEGSNEVYHNSVLTRKTRNKYYELIVKKDKLRQFKVNTYRYIYFLNRKYMKDLVLPVLEYPKLDSDSNN